MTNLQLFLQGLENNSRANERAGQTIADGLARKAQRRFSAEQADVSRQFAAGQDKLQFDRQVMRDSVGYAADFMKEQRAVQREAAVGADGTPRQRFEEKLIGQRQAGDEKLLQMRQAADADEIARKQEMEIETAIVSKLPGKLQNEYRSIVSAMNNPPDELDEGAKPAYFAKLEAQKDALFERAATEAKVPQNDFDQQQIITADGGAGYINAQGNFTKTAPGFYERYEIINKAMAARGVVNITPEMVLAEMRQMDQLQDQFTAARRNPDAAPSVAPALAPATPEDAGVAERRQLLELLTAIDQEERAK